MTDDGRPTVAPPPPSERTSRDRRKSLIAALVGLAIAVFVFGFLLPQVINYQTVWETIKSLDPIDIVVLIVAGLLLYLPEGALYASIMPGMGLRRGAAAWVSSTAVGTTIPAADLVVRFAMYRSWGFAVERSMLGILLSGLFDNVVKFTLPAIAVILIAVSGVADVGDFAVIAIIAIGVLAGGAALVTGIIQVQQGKLPDPSALFRYRHPGRSLLTWNTSL
jgi:uncharacterized membrane protein YbhN (UPF0104 family)